MHMLRQVTYKHDYLPTMVDYIQSSQFLFYHIPTNHVPYNQVSNNNMPHSYDMSCKQDATLLIHVCKSSNQDLVKLILTSQVANINVIKNKLCKQTSPPFLTQKFKVISLHQRDKAYNHTTILTFMQLVEKINGITISQKPNRQQSIVLNNNTKFSLIVFCFFSTFIHKRKEKSTSKKIYNKKSSSLFHLSIIIKNNATRRTTRFYMVQRRSSILMGKETFQKLVQRRITLHVSKILKEGTY